MIRLLHLADVHLGAPFLDFGDQAETRRQEVLDAFKALLQLAESAEVHAVLVAGDLFDSARPSEFTLAVARQTIRRLVDTGHPVFIVPGSHDAHTVNPDLYGDQFGGAFVFREPVFRAPISVETAAGPLHVYGLGYDWTHPDPLGSFRRHDAPGTHVVLLHGSVASLSPWRSQVNLLRIPIEWLVGVDADYVALGGGHAFRGPADFETDTTTRACYCGSFAAIDLAETGPRGFVIVELDADHAPRVTHHPSKIRHSVDLGTVDVTPHVDEAAIAAAIAARVEGDAFPAARLEGEPAMPLDAERVVAHLERRFGRAKLTDATWYAGSKRLDDLAEQDTIAGYVVRLGRQRILEAIGDPQAPVLAERALRLALRSLKAG
jgi:DNA repair exonuclease SbcCD nuclease subunit